MTDNNQDSNGFDDSGYEETENIGTPRSANVNYDSAKKNATQNLKQTFGSGPGLFAAIAVGVVVLLFVAFAIKGFNNGSDSRAGNVDQPNSPSKQVGEAVSPEEAERRRQVAILEANAAAESGQTYQTSFDVNVQDSRNNYDGNAGFNINGEAPTTPVQASGAVATPNQQTHEQQLAAQQQAAADAAFAQQKQAYTEALEERDRAVQGQRQLIGTQIEGIYKNMLPNGRHTSSVYYTPQDKNQNPNGNNNGIEESTALIGNSGSINNSNLGGNSLNGGQATRAPFIKAGSMLFAQLDAEIDTDDGGPVMATIYGGKLNGAKLLGQVQKGNDNIRLAFQTVSPVAQNQPTFGINAVALRTEDAKQGIAESINRHTISRYTSLVFSSALAGVGNAYSRSTGTGTVTQLQNGTTVVQQNPVNDREIIGQAVGQVGQNLSSEALRGFNRPVTYKVPRGTGLAIYFLTDVYLN